MNLIAFRVKMYKGIIDSDWVDVNPLTVLVGKNESGKTSLLRALHKLNPHTPDPYDMAREWPRARRKERSEEYIACQAKFQLSDQEKFDLAQITGQEKIPDTVEVSRNYAGQLKTNFEEDILSDKLPHNDINNAFDALPKVEEEFSNQFKQHADECLKEARHLASEGQLTELTELAQKHESLLREAISPSDPPQQIEAGYTNQYLRGLSRLVQTLGQLPSIQSEVHEYVTNRLPTFIYMSDYRSFSGTAQLNEIKSRQDSNSLTEEDKTFLTILNLSALDLEDLVRFGQGNAETVEQRQYNLDDGAATLTKEITDRLRQRSL